MGASGLGAVPASDRTEAALSSCGDVSSLAEGWDALAARALEPNVFLSRWMAEARLRHLPDRSRARILAAFRGAGGERRLVGLSLLVPARGRRFNPLPVLRTAELYAPLSTPLLDPDRPAEIWRAMLDALGRAGVPGLALPHVAADGPVAAALREAADGGGFPLASLGRHRRAVLDSDLGGAAYLQATLERRRRREFDRQRRRLAELGPLDFVVSSGADRGQALADFVALEAAGWKGRSGTALAQAAGAEAYFREIADRAPPGDFRIASLRLGGRPVAAGLVAVAGRRAFYVKTSYDETLARFSPGLLLTLDLTAHLLDDRSIDGADSVADADHPMIDRVWSERMSVESCLVGTRAGAGIAYLAALSAERGREAAIGAARALTRRGGTSRPPERP